MHGRALALAVRRLPGRCVATRCPEELEPWIESALYRHEDADAPPPLEPKASAPARPTLVRQARR